MMGYRPMHRFWLSFLLAASICAAAPLAVAEPKVSTFTLENGMRGVVIEDHRAPVATHMVWYRVGSADEPPSETGVAHFLEHLLFKGTGKYPEGAFSRIVAENGGQQNAFTSYDYTSYYQRIAVDRLDLMMELEADRMVNLQLTDADVATERDVVLEERNMRTENEPGSRFREQLTSSLYLNHPYGDPVIGWRSEILALGRENALSFYRRFYSPDNATLVVAGDVDPVEVEAMARRHYGPIPPSNAHPAERPQEPPHVAAFRVEMQDPRVAQPYMMRLYLVPSIRTGAEGEGAALSVLAEILGGGGVTSRLGERLQIEKEMALGASAFYWGVSRDDTSFGVYAAPVDGVGLAEIEAEVDAVITRLIEEGPTAEELARAKTVIIADEIYSQDSQSSMAQSYGSALSVGLTLEQVQGWEDAIDAVTADEVRRAAAAYLVKERSTTGWLTKPAPAAEAASGDEDPKG